jgi:non-heme chloroperoxidase
MKEEPSIEWFGKLAVSHALSDERRSDIPILFVHGACGGKWQFENWQRYCAQQGWESYALDLRGHHQSPSDDLGNVRLRDYADDVEEVIKKIGSCYLVGHSMGGLVVQIVASRNSDIKKAVLVTSAPSAGILFLNKYLFAMIKYLPERFAHKSFSLTRHDALRFLIDRLDPKLFDTFVAESARAGTDIVFTRVENIQCPTLVVAAELDRLLPISVQRRIARKYNSTYIELADTGHMVVLEEEWKRPIERILQWLKL